MQRPMKMANINVPQPIIGVPCGPSGLPKKIQHRTTPIARTVQSIIICVICGYVDCHIGYQLVYHIENHPFCHKQASQKRSTFLATVSTVTGCTCSHSLGNNLR